MAITGIGLVVCCTGLGPEHVGKMAPVEAFEQSHSSSVGKRGHHPAMICFSGFLWGSLAFGVKEEQPHWQELRGVCRGCGATPAPVFLSWWQGTQPHKVKIWMLGFDVTEPCSACVESRCSQVSRCWEMLCQAHGKACQVVWRLLVFSSPGHAPKASVQCLVQGRQTSVKTGVGRAAPALGQPDSLGDLLRPFPALSETNFLEKYDLYRLSACLSFSLPNYFGANRPILNTWRMKENRYLRLGDCACPWFLGIVLPVLPAEEVAWLVFCVATFAFCGLGSAAGWVCRILVSVCEQSAQA